jgi:hypothetical protein
LIRIQDEANVERLFWIIEAKNFSDNQSIVINNVEDQIHQQVGREEISRKNL